MTDAIDGLDDDSDEFEDFPSDVEEARELLLGRVEALIATICLPGLDDINAADRAAVAVLMALAHAIRGRADLEELALLSIAYSEGTLSYRTGGGPAPIRGGPEP